MKFRACVLNSHGSCQGVMDLPYLDDQGDPVFVDRKNCDCWCHNNEDPLREPNDET